MTFHVGHVVRVVVGSAVVIVGPGVGVEGGVGSAVVLMVVVAPVAVLEGAVVAFVVVAGCTTTVVDPTAVV